MTSLPDGFIPHEGGKCPVASDTWVTVMLRDGAIIGPEPAGLWQAVPYDWWRWEDHDNDIIAYKVENPS